LDKACQGHWLIGRNGSGEEKKVENIDNSSAGFTSNIGDNDDDLYEFRFLFKQHAVRETEALSWTQKMAPQH
jgi:hypothetical protein